MLNLTQLLSSQNNNLTLRYSQDNLPVIVWNLTPTCNLNCSFCYYDAVKAGLHPGINYALALRIARQLKEAKIKYLLLSGGEPLLYPQILTLIEELVSSSIRVGLSTNGTLINKEWAFALKRSGLDYVGISLDGLKDTHNRLRKSPAAFNQALMGLSYAQEAGLKTGIRLTLSSYNFKQIRNIFSLAEGLKVQRLCFYHLVYSGRAKSNNDLTRAERKKTIELIIDLTIGWINRKIATEVLTVDNFSDGVILLDYLRKKKSKNYPLVLELLRKQGGCPAGRGILSIDHLGFLHPCQFWTEYRLADLNKGNLLEILNSRPSACNPRESALLKGRCGICDFKEICAGCRVRAFQAHRDYWQDDPACCLEDSEINNKNYLNADTRKSNADIRRLNPRPSAYHLRESALKKKGCLAGREYCLVSPEGDVYPCPYLPLKIDNIRLVRFSKIWKENLIFKALRGNNLKGRCSRCEFAFYCRGCRANSFYYRKDILEEDPQCTYQPDSFLDSLDKKLIDYLQEDFPLVLEPFRDSADRLDLTEDEVLFRVSRLKSIGIIKRIGPIYNPEKLGFKRTLVAMSVPEDKLGEITNLVNGFAEVTHNYLRDDHKFNLWFTLIGPTQNRIKSIIKDIKTRSGISKIISLPTLKTIKVRAVFKA